jgi:hypothetical protein
MTNHLWKNKSLLIPGVVLICLVVMIVEVQLKVLRRAYDHYVLDNRNHYLSCTELPTKAEVERIVEEHRDTIQQIQQVAPGLVGLEIDASACAGKADLLIWYGTHRQRTAIENIIAGDTFFGVPYRLQNR